MARAALPADGHELEWDLERALDVATEAVAAGRLPCLVFGVVDAAGRREVFALSGPGTDVHEGSIFFLASVTKAIVATAVMQYVDEGRLDLHAPISRTLPGFEGEGREGICAWHILTHTSGLPDVPIERLRTERPTYARLLAQTMASAPRWEPGSRYEYNSSAWCLLSETMAHLSSSAWPAVLHQRLLDPLGMSDTTFDGRRKRRRIVPVVGAGNRLVSEILLWFLARAQMPGGGLFGTVPDLLRLGHALLGPHLLSSGTIARMAEQQVRGIPAVDEDGSLSYLEHGLGWRRPGEDWPSGSAVLTHGGQTGTRLWVDPERGFAFAFLTNVWGAEPDTAIAILREVYRALPG